MTTRREARLQRAPEAANGHPHEAAVRLGRVVPPVELDLKEQAKLNEIAKTALTAQQTLAQAQQNLKEAEMAVREIGGRLSERLEVVLERRGLDPEQYQWNFDGETLMIKPR